MIMTRTVLPIGIVVLCMLTVLVLKSMSPEVRVDSDLPTLPDSLNLVESLADEGSRLKVLDISLRPLMQEEAEQIEERTRPKVQEGPLTVHQTIIHPSDQLVSKGLEILNSDDSKSLPRLLGDYRMNLGFNSYADQMLKRGAVFGIIERGRGSVNWLVDVKDNALLPVTGLAGMSRQTRRIESEPAVSWAISKAKTLRSGQYDVVLLVPQRMEAYLTASMDQVAKLSDHRLADFRSIRASYLTDSGSLFLVLNRGVLNTGESVPLNSRIRL